MSKVDSTRGYSDSSLIQIIRSGNPSDAASAFGVLFDRTNDSLCRFLGGRGLVPLEIEAVAQETWSRAVEFLPMYEDRGIPFLAWLRTTAINVWREQLRERPRTQALPEDYDAVATDEWSRDPLDQLSDQEDQDELRATLREVFANLKPDHRTVLERRLILGESSQEVGARLGWTVSKVDTTLHRARAACREKLIARYAGGHHSTIQSGAPNSPFKTAGIGPAGHRKEGNE